MRKGLSGTAVRSAAPLSVELWRDIPGYEGSYQVSSFGRVRSLPRMVPVYDSVRRVSYSRPCPGKILRQAVCDRAGHVSVHLGKYCRGIPVHQLVMLAFYGYPPAGMEVMHLNGIPTDNRPENLRYGTHSENMTDMYRKGKGRIKLTPEDVSQIRFGLSCGWSMPELAAAYRVS
nr:NUMOD4 motif-containing HNH endonuclease [Clostridiales bacterium]